MFRTLSKKLSSISLYNRLLDKIALFKQQRASKKFSKAIEQKQLSELARIKQKNQVRVVFLAIHESVWKVDSVFQKMLEDPFFDPLILICPYVLYGSERMFEDMQQAYEYLSHKGYPVMQSYDKRNDTWVELEDLKPDLLFFTNPHRLTLSRYYEDAYTQYLSCYVPYFYLVTTHDGNQSIYNQDFHNAMWKIFMPHEVSMQEARKNSSIQARNCVLTGYPFCEGFLANSKKGSAWKWVSPEHKRIIFAPHHTIEERGELRLSNFLLLADFFMELAKKFQGRLQWSFKPHPALKSKLYLHQDWGKEKTDKYYAFWAEAAFTQLDTGDYTQLFLESDAIIHDSASFIAEYLFVNKPCLYLMVQGDHQVDSINPFGKRALESYTYARSKADVEDFVVSVLEETAKLQPSHYDYIEEEIRHFYEKAMPSDRILRSIKADLTGSR